MNKKKIFIAVDTNSISKAKKIISNTQTNKIKVGYKFGLEFFYSKDGRKFLSNLKNQLNKFFNITLPQITAIISILFMIRFIWNFNKFEDIFLLTGGASGTRTLPINVYEQGFAISNIGMGSAVSMVIVLILIIFMISYFKLIGKKANEL